MVEDISALCVRACMQKCLFESTVAVVNIIVGVQCKLIFKVSNWQSGGLE